MAWSTARGPLPRPPAHLRARSDVTPPPLRCRPPSPAPRCPPPATRRSPDGAALSSRVQVGRGMAEDIGLVDGAIDVLPAFLFPLYFIRVRRWGQPDGVTYRRRPLKAVIMHLGVI